MNRLILIVNTGYRRGVLLTIRLQPIINALLM